jgi:DNA-binding SARP family transcriptional activator
VFALLPDALQVFLLRTSVAESLTATLMAELSELPVDAPTPRPSVSAMVRELRKRNLFISTDEDGTVIRYHTLFRDFLRRRLPARFSTRRVVHLYTSASGHMLRSGDIAGAVDLLLASGQFEKAAQTIERSLQEFLARGQTRTLLRLVEALPDVMQDNPWFLFARAIACRFTDPRSSLALHERALSRFRAERNIAGQMLSLGGVIEACFHSGGDFVRMERAARQARFLLGRSRRQPVELRARLLLALGTAWFFIGRLQRGADALQHALDLFRSRNNHFSQLSCAVYLAPCALYQGDFRLARDAVRRGFEALRAIPDESGGEAALYLVRSMSALFEGLFGDARESLDACRRIAQELRLEAIDLLILEIDGWLKIAQGDYHGAEAVLDECRRKGEEFEKAFFSVSAAHLLSIVYLFQRKLDKAQRMSAYALASRSQSGSRLFHAIYLIVNGAIQMKLGRQDQAEQELLTAVSLLRECAAAQQEANAHLMLALFYGSIKRPDKARRHLRKGFSLGQERGFVYYATFTPKELRELAREAVANNICVEHCTRLLDHPILTAAAPIIIRCLGEFRVTRQGELITDSEWKGKRTKMLVKMLAAHDGQKITRDTVVDILWPDSHLDRHPQLFRTLLHRTRKVLDPVYAPAEDLSFINQEAGSAALNRTLVWTDTGAFLGALKKAESRRSGGDPRETLKAFENAISLYGGDLLPADAHEDWTITLRAQFRRLYARALDEAAEISESLKEHGRSQALYERMFDFDQCNDKACRWLMMRHVSDGRRNEAIRTYERHERALSRELDMVPDEQTRRLYRNIIGG